MAGFRAFASCQGQVKSESEILWFHVQQKVHPFTQVKGRLRIPSYGLSTVSAAQQCSNEASRKRKPSLIIPNTNEGAAPAASMGAEIKAEAGSGPHQPSPQ